MQRQTRYQDARQQDLLDTSAMADRQAFGCDASDCSEPTEMPSAREDRDQMLKGDSPMSKQSVIPNSDRQNESTKKWAKLVRDNGSVVTLTKDKLGEIDIEQVDGMTMVWGS